MSEISPERLVPISGYSYQISRMSVFDQMSLATELRDIIIGLAMMRKSREPKMTDELYHMGTRFIIMSPARMAREERQAAYNLCLGVVKRRDGAVGWMPVLASQGQMQFQDIGLPEITRLIYEVIDHHRLLDFFYVSPSTSDGQTTEGNGSGLDGEKTG